MISDWGTVISDFKGNLVDASRDAFDSFHNGYSVTSMLKQPFENTFKEFRSKIGKEFNIDAQKPLTLESLSDKVGTTLRDNAIQLGADYALQMAGKYVGELEGPLGMLISEAASIAIGEFEKYLGKTNYKTGQWVFLDVGSQVHHVNEKPKIIELRSEDVGEMFGFQDEFAIIPEELDLQATAAQHAIGFYLGKDNGSDYLLQCFSFQTGKEQTFHEDKVRPIPQSLAEKLDNDDNFNKVREIRFLKGHEVIFANKAWRHSLFQEGKTHHFATGGR